MDQASQQKLIENFLQEYLEDKPEVFIVEVKIRPGNNIDVFTDADNGITIDTCTKMNRALYKYLEEKEVYTDNDFAIEVSSPGVEEPLLLLRQYKKNVGRTVEVTNNDESVITGKLQTVTDEEITVEVKEGKANKATTKTVHILLNQIRHTKVLVTF
jgi:ribosome maturation factor RimP